MKVKYSFSLILLTIFLVVISSYGNNNNISFRIRRKYKSNRLRVLVLDFTSISDGKEASGIANIIRNEFGKDKNFATLKIDAINKLIVSKKYKKEDAGISKYAAYIGNRLRAHKVLVGNVSGNKEYIIIDVKIVDVASKKIEISKRFKAKKIELNKKIPGFVKSIANSILEIGRKWKPGGDLRSSFISGVSVSSGILLAQEDFSEYLNPALLTTVHLSISIPFFSWTNFEFSTGFSSLKAKKIENGKADLLFVPMLLSATIRFPISLNPIAPKPLLLFGGGATYVKLDKVENDISTSNSGFDPTFIVGLGASFAPYKSFFIQIEAKYYYLFEKMSVSYFYGGLRLGLFI